VKPRWPIEGVPSIPQARMIGGGMCFSVKKIISDIKHVASVKKNEQLLSTVPRLDLRSASTS